jgi:hypothetical protein
VAGSCEYGKESLGSIKDRDSLDGVTVSFSRTLLLGVTLLIMHYEVISIPLHARA